MSKRLLSRNEMDLLTMAEAASILRVSRESVRRRIKDGSIRAVRVGPRSVRVVEDDVRALMTPVQLAKKVD